MTTLRELIQHLESIAPLSLQESYDNAGLIVGSPDTEIRGVLVSLDCTEEIIAEAVKTGCNVVVSHHPIVFGGIKKLNGKNYVERTVLMAIRNDVAIYAIHTNLDNIQTGVNRKIAERLGLTNVRILSPKKGVLRKLVTFCPVAQSTDVREALFRAGAGNIGNYDACSFNLKGSGTFRGGEGTNPFVGQPGKMHVETEERIEVIYEAWREGAIVSALKAAHPYEEVAYDLYPLENSHQGIGAGMVGELTVPVSEADFLRFLKESMQTACIRHTQFSGKMVQKVAICGGSGSFLLNEAKNAGAQVFVTADYKYHQFFDAEGRILIADIGHYESEQFTGELLKAMILEKFSTFAVRLTEVNTNPVFYY